MTGVGGAGVMRATLKGGAPPDESGGFHRRGMPASESGRYNSLIKQIPHTAKMRRVRDDRGTGAGFDAPS